ncbi:hypothetical protein MCOR25_006070 [Pyricularia grisea]|nr:hypothetical protein MCOR25_006070 [Pyricularia grisea]
MKAVKKKLLPGMMAAAYANAAIGEKHPKHASRESLVSKTIQDSGGLEINIEETANKACSDTGMNKITPLILSHQGSAQDPTDGYFKKMIATSHLQSTAYGGTS